MLKLFKEYKVAYKFKPRRKHSFKKLFSRRLCKMVAASVTPVGCMLTTNSKICSITLLHMYVGFFFFF